MQIAHLVLTECGEVQRADSGNSVLHMIETYSTVSMQYQFSGMTAVHLFNKYAKRYCNAALL